MSKYIKLEDEIHNINLEVVGRKEYTGDMKANLFFALDDLPTIEVSEDCISRVTALDIAVAYVGAEMVDRMLTAPSVVPTVRKNRTTAEQSSMVGKWQITDAYPHNVYCSECHKKFAQTHWAVWEDGSLPRNYCPNCGAKVKGADE